MRRAAIGAAAGLLLAGFLAGAAEAALIRGRVVDVDGRPLAGVKLFVYDSANIRRPASFISPPSAADGTAVITVPPGIYRVVARIKADDSYGPLMPGDKHSGEPAVMDLTAEAELEQEFTVADIRDLGRRRQAIAVDSVKLSGRVLDREGKPVANAYVFASAAGDAGRFPDYISAWTGEDGRYALIVPAGRKHYVGSATRFPASAWRPSAEVSPAAGKSDIALDVALGLD
uniref:Carboxypeptidase regulatory-like domain-containing protein n=1 Tax=Geobacter metallireducens TaxID=28232 RepID=A0A831XDL5_GEOME